LESAAEGDENDRQVMTRLGVALSAVLAALVCAAAPTKTSAAKKRPAVPVARSKAAPESAYRRTPYVGAISADAESGRILFSENADRTAYPASVTKLMTALLVLEDVKRGRYSLGDKVTATVEAYQSEPSWIGIKAGQSMSVDDLLMALMVMSANDAAVVLAVNSAGSLSAFVERMNARAAELGMKNTAYYNPSGLPPNARRKYPWKKFNRSTAADQLKLALEIIRHPEIFKYTSTKVATVVDGNGKSVNVLNHNRIMRMDKFKIFNPDGSEAVDRLKTGYINAGGSSIVLTGKRGGKRAVVVVLGSVNANTREEHASRILKDALGALSW
jgi:D-alanyl-D-alanine carboxypeptidase (penicillin-binding protein 5/6)